MAPHKQLGRPFLPLLLVPLQICGLYFVYHFPLMPAYSLAGAVWPPLALSIPVLLLLVLFGRERCSRRFPRVWRLGAILYTVWLAAFALLVVGLQWLVDRRMALLFVAAALAAGESFGRKRRAWLGPAIFAVCLGGLAWREPFLAASQARLIFSLFLTAVVGALFVGGAWRRVRQIDFAALVLLAPVVFSLHAFYHGPVLAVPADPAVRFLFPADSPAIPKIGAGKDLRYAVRDCTGALLLGSGESPGLERIDDGAATSIDQAPAGDNLEAWCDAGAAGSGLLYGARTGEVVWRSEESVTRRQLGEPVLMVAGRASPAAVYAMGNKSLLALLSRPQLAVQAQRGGGQGFFGALFGSGVNIDLLYEAENESLFRSAMLRGVEKLDPDSLETIARYPLPASVGGTLALDVAGKRLFVSDWLGRRIMVLDVGDLRPLGRLAAPRGVRRLVYDPARRLLLAGSYFTGEVLIYGPGDERPRHRLPVGRRVRGLALAGGRCLGVSAAGIFEIEPAALEARR